jgi:Ras-related protein Rab-21
VRKMKNVVIFLSWKIYEFYFSRTQRFKAMAPLYYRNANAALLVFDVTNHRSFEEVKSWVLELQKNVQEPMYLLLVGNKIDLVEQRTVSHEEAMVYAQSIGAQFVETSVVKDQVKLNFSLIFFA